MSTFFLFRVTVTECLGIAASNGLAALDDSNLKPKFSDRKLPQRYIKDYKPHIDNHSAQAGEWSPDLRQSNEVLDRWQNMMLLFNDYAAVASHRITFVLLDVEFCSQQSPCLRSRLQAVWGTSLFPSTKYLRLNYFILLPYSRSHSWERDAV
jgi:hypothetical protein